MSVYQLGLAVSGVRVPNNSAYNRGLVVGIDIATPGRIKDEAISLNTEVQAMAIELGNERSSWGLVSDDQLDEKRKAMDVWWKAVWSPFYVEWTKFYDAHGGTWGLRNWYENFWGSSWEAVQQYRQRLLDLRLSAEQIGYYFRAPLPTAPKESDGVMGSLGKALSEFLSKLVWVVVLVGGMFVIYKLIPAGGFHGVGA